MTVKTCGAHAGWLTGLLLAAILPLPGACARRPSLTTDTRSRQFLSDAEKTAFLGRYLELPSVVEAAEFHVRFHDSSGGLVPGPSDWDIQAVVRVRPADVSRWAEGLEPVPQEREASVDLGWGRTLLPDEPRWQVRSRPALFMRDDGSAVVALFEPEGIVMKRVVGR